MSWKVPIPYEHKWLHTFLKRNSKHAALDYAYIRTFIKMFNDSQLHICIPDEVKSGMVKLLAQYVTTEEIIEEAYKKGKAK